MKITNPPDRYALEAALRLRDATGGEVIALTVGDAEAEDTAREAVAMGADRGLLITSSQPAEVGGRGVARAIAAAANRLGEVDLLLTGEIDAVNGTGSLAARLSAALGWPVVLDVICLNQINGTLEATVAAGAAAQTVSLSMPAVAAVVPGSDRPRFPHPRRIATAWDTGLVEVVPASDLGLEDQALAAGTQNTGLVLGPERTRKQEIKGTPDEAAEALLNMLRTRRLAG